MRGAILLLAGLVGGCAPSAPTAGGGIVSTNPCADAMLLQLVPARRIAAISHYSRDPSATSIPLDVAARFPTTHGTAEEVVAMRPDLVIASSFTNGATREAYRRAGLRTLYLDSPTSIAASIEQVRMLANALAVPRAGEAMARKIERSVAAAHWPGEPVPALLWLGGDLASGGGTLLDEMMRRAGFHDAAVDYGLQGTGPLPAERVVAAPPRVMIAPDANDPGDRGRAAQLRARAIAASGRHVLQAQFDRRLMNCGGPVIADAMTRLAQVRREVGR